MYSTSLKTWARAVGIDSILIGARPPSEQRGGR